jgi:hypothetical protein
MRQVGISAAYGGFYFLSFFAAAIRASRRWRVESLRTFAFGVGGIFAAFLELAGLVAKL